MREMAVLATFALTFAACGVRAASPPPHYWGVDDEPMVDLGGGETAMGTRHGAPDERPVHLVALRPYKLDLHEVTNRRYRKFEDWMREHRDHSLCFPKEPANKDHAHHDYGRGFGEADEPVVGVDWYDAYAFAAWEGKRLPTEAEWERAAKGGLASVYPWGDRFSEDLANCESKLGHPSPVGAYAGGASPCGLLDMAGNVWEWCYDWYSAEYYAELDKVNPTGPDAGTERVLRGGSWLDFANALRTTFRGKAPAETRKSCIGFRCAR